MIKDEMPLCLYQMKYQLDIMLRNICCQWKYERIYLIII